MIGWKVTATLMMFLLDFIEHPITTIYKDWKSILSNTKRFLKENNERKLVSELAILAQILTKIAAQKKKDFSGFLTHC